MPIRLPSPISVSAPVEHSTSNTPPFTTHHGEQQSASVSGGCRADHLGAREWGRRKEKKREEGGEKLRIESDRVGGDLKTASLHSGAMIHNLPVESLVHVFAHLPPRSMLACTLVCKDWHELIRDESTWRNAFIAYFGLDNASEIGIAPGRRLEPSSWRSEYILRTNLLARWRKPRASTTTHDPRVGAVSALHADFKPSDPYMLSASVANGIAARSDPWTGRIARGFAEADPSNFIGLGQPGNVAGELEATALAIAPDASKIAWGMRNGELRITSLARSGQQRTLRSIGDLDDRHRSSITAISFAPFPVSSDSVTRLPALTSNASYVATCSLDGGVKIWDVRNLIGRNAGSGACIWTAPQRLLSSDGAIDAAVRIAFDPGYFSGQDSQHCGTVTVGTAAGFVHVWTSLDIQRLSNPGVGQRPDSLTSSYTLTPPPKENSLAVDVLHIDPTQPASMLFHHEGEVSFTRVWPTESQIVSAAPSRVSYIIGDSAIDEITALRPDFDVLSIVWPRATSASVYGNNKYVAAGDSRGSVYLWDWARSEDIPKGGSPPIYPVRRIANFDVKVTVLEVSPFLLFAGSIDGNIRVYDILSGATVRVFSERAAARHPARVLAAGQATQEEVERYAVSNIRATRDAFVASIGMRVLAFRLSQSSDAKKRRKSAGRVPYRTDPFRDFREIRHELDETRADMEAESADLQARQRHASRVNRIAGPPPGMTEDEAVQYALLLSSEEAERSRFEEGSFEEELARLAFDDDVTTIPDGPHRTPSGASQSSQSSDISEDDTGTSPRSPTFSSSPSPFGSRRPSTQNFAGFDISSPSWGRNASASPHLQPRRESTSKLQISPRPSPYLNPTLHSTTPSSPPPNLSEALWPTPSPRAGSSPRSGDASASSPPPIAKSVPPAKLSWSAAAKSTSSSPIGLPSAFAIRHASSPSLLTSRLQQSRAPSATTSQHNVSSLRGEMDDDLRFAIELSLAEERSRQERAAP